MKMTEKDTHFFAVCISVIAHLVLLLMIFPDMLPVKKPKEKKIIIPIQMAMPQEPPKVEKVIKKVKRAKKAKAPKKVAKKPKPKPKPKKPEKPKPMPGDRKEPILASKTDPIYPKSAMNNEWEGTIIVEVVVDSTGKALKVKVLRSSGYSVLDKSFIRTVKQYYTFAPKRVAGKDVKGRIKLSYSFSLEG